MPPWASASTATDHFPPRGEARRARSVRSPNHVSPARRSAISCVMANRWARSCAMIARLSAANAQCFRSAAPVLALDQGRTGVEAGRRNVPPAPESRNSIFGRQEPAEQTRPAQVLMTDRPLSSHCFAKEAPRCLQLDDDFPVNGDFQVSTWQAPLHAAMPRLEVSASPTLQRRPRTGSSCCTASMPHS